MNKPHLFIAIPLMDEWESLPVLIEDLTSQSYPGFHIVFCINQPDHWWNDPEKKSVCEHNALCLDYLLKVKDLPLTVIDKSSPGKGWDHKNYGVGWARKTAMDHCLLQAKSTDLLVSLDGDTRFKPGYLASLTDTLSACPEAVALSVPYYHCLTGKEEEDRAILRYEIYMRYYVLNLWRIRSHYSFTALGSAMALPVKSYKAIRGMTPNKSGEDFYFLQKLRKYGSVLFWNPEKVYPAARFSNRVFFGTGPAMIKGRMNDWSSYPLYSPGHFDDIAKTCDLFPVLFTEKVKTPMDAFLKSIFNEEDIWEPIRQNHPDKQRFIRACHEKVDGLRILQYLKSNNLWGNTRDEFHLKQYFIQFVTQDTMPAFLSSADFTLSDASTEQLNLIRDILCREEEACQQQHYQYVIS